MDAQTIIRENIIDFRTIQRRLELEEAAARQVIKVLRPRLISLIEPNYDELELFPNKFKMPSEVSTELQDFKSIQVRLYIGRLWRNIYRTRAEEAFFRHVPKRTPIQAVTLGSLFRGRTPTEQTEVLDGILTAYNPEDGTLSVQDMKLKVADDMTGIYSVRIFEPSEKSADPELIKVAQVHFGA